jgi:hypothetical protein
MIIYLLSFIGIGLCSFAFGFWLCDRLKDRRAERAEAALRKLKLNK